MIFVEVRDILLPEVDPAQGVAMKKTAKQFRGSTDSCVLGDETFAAISAVEGISLSASSKQRLMSMRQRKLTATEQRAEIIRAYSDTKSR